MHDDYLRKSERKTEYICSEVIKHASVSELRSKYLTYFINLQYKGQGFVIKDK